MDSSNSGSFQSSSGAAGGGAGDNEEYDSRTHSISSFFNPSNHFNPNLNHLLPPPPPPSHHHHRPPPTDSTFFNPVQDPGSAWTGTYLINPNLSTMDTNTKPAHGSDHHHQNHNHNQIGVSIKNPKKRTRASRRAPTTILTTDTTNFRQMVQEFTGIPTSPFTTNPLSRRLDLFRPTPHKLQQPPPFLNPTANNIIVESGTSSSSFQLQPSNIHEFQKQPSTLLDLQNPMVSFQTLLQTSLPQHSNGLHGFQSSSKRWGDQTEKLESFENDNIGRSKLDSGLDNVVVSSRSGGDQVQVGVLDDRLVSSQLRYLTPT
ncbi:hypothetical protein L1987_23717 [Smallanthus sonchifolius]|uniref:Uncharacterized protein n=1 Tax=Smallanthus sonchifolius TaxID=185202 RepID=A0ACB9IJS1_9ASTR|nr:hypothetical protein L1987_23717 [Smallanthus sonchifolius]